MERRNHTLDLLRLAFAILVLLSHAPEITDGNHSREIGARLFHMTFGSIGVDGFFLLSGFLIVKSWQKTPKPIDYLTKRILRIVPGYLVAVLLSTLVVGLLAPGVEGFFRKLGVPYAISVLVLGAPVTPIVFPGCPLNTVNGSLWTITFEFGCYLLVLLFGVLGLFRWRFLCLAWTVVLLGDLFHPYFHHHNELIAAVRLTAVFSVGACFYLFRDHIVFRPLFAAIAAVVGTTLLVLLRHNTEGSIVVFGGYLMFYLVQLPLKVPSFPDISYGVYLYGYPIEALWIWYHRGSPWVTFLVATLISIGVGWLSWEFVERPMLLLKRKALSPASTVT